MLDDLHRNGGNGGVLVRSGRIQFHDSVERPGRAFGRIHLRVHDPEPELTVELRVRQSGGGAGMNGVIPTRAIRRITYVAPNCDRGPGLEDSSGPCLIDGV